MAATDLKHLFTAQIDLGGGLVIQLNAIPIRLVGFVEREAQRRVLLVAVVEKGDLFRIQSASQERVPDSCS